MTSPTQTLPTHEEIAQRAHRLWQDLGCPANRDTEIWLSAEQQLLSQAAPHHAASNGDIASAPAASVQQAITAALQKKDARMPQVPHHTSPPAKPLVSGKPVWPKAHSN
jgi:hypothetical protein